MQKNAPVLYLGLAHFLLTKMIAPGRFKFRRRRSKED
jgi:hypothetical protein